MMVSRAADHDDWRSKYYDSLRAAEREDREYRNQIDVLHKLINRLCVTAQGQSAALDEQLKRLKEAVRRQAPADQFEPLGQAIADAVHSMDTATNAAPTSATSSGIRHLVTPAEPTPEVAAAADRFVPDDDRLRSVLSRLLSELRRDPQLSVAADAIGGELKASLDDGGLPRLVEQIGGLVVQRIAGLEKARQELEILLGQMMGQLDSLTRYIASQDDDESHRKSSSTDLNNQITGEVRAIGESVESGTDLMQIRRQLRERLNSISRHLHTFRAREEERTRQSRERTESMRARMEELEGEARKLQARLTDEKRLSLLDPLTQIPNRLAWEQRLAEELDRWKRFGQPTCLAAWDIDRFKVINDSYGHRAGDKVLAVVAEALAQSIRSTDFIARFGGEEFVMLLPGTTVEDGIRLADQMREAVAQIGFHFRGNPVSVSISCGITAFRAGDGEDDAFDRADKAMYKAKEGGRNRVVSV